MKRELQREGVSPSEIERITTSLLGKESDGVRTMGLVDHDDDESFTAAYNSLKSTMPETFTQWLETRRGRHRSLLDSMKKCMLRPVRSAAGLGDPPNQWTNNASECMHNVMKESLNKDVLDCATFLERVKEKVFRQQFNEMVRGIRGLGEYRLVKRKKHLQVNVTEWMQMSEKQRESKIISILHSPHIPEVANDTAYVLSINYTDLQTNLTAPIYVLQRIWNEAIFILSNYQIQELVSGVFCVPDVEMAYNVTPQENFGLSCSCKRFHSTNGLCCHVVAVAEKRGFLADFIIYIGKKFNDINKIIYNRLPKQAGDKPRQSKKRKGRNNRNLHPIIDAQCNRDEIDYPKECRFTEYYHNNERFTVDFLDSNDCKRAKNCISCDISFPKSNACPEQQIVVIHKERYERPVTDNTEKFLRMTVTKKLGRKFYCPKRECVLSRHPYFYKGMMDVSENASTRLNLVQRKHLNNNFHLSL